MTEKRTQIAVSALLIFVFWTMMGIVGGGSGGILVPLLLLKLAHVKPTECGMFEGSLAVTGCTFGLMFGIITGAVYGNYAVRRKFGPRWRDRIRNRTQPHTDYVDAR